MNTHYVLVMALGIGIVAVLRAMTAPAMVSWAAHLGWINLHGSPLRFMEFPIAVAILSLAALGEYVNDKLPNTPSRTAPPSFIARLVMGGLSGATLSSAGGQSLAVGAVLGAVGAIIGTLVGYKARTGLVRTLKVKDIFVAIPEDIVAIVLAYCIVTFR